MNIDGRSFKNLDGDVLWNIEVFVIFVFICENLSRKGMFVQDFFQEADF